ncbi:MAG: type II toxin-antitoxin system VapB family antitoxin [SAR324 cluster bacterium]|jgi:Arc/MetJ family transcription regulator|nr:type II toxin-antitoxin system VapB family antitoxin [SAR324 cluster bacterium]
MRTNLVINDALMSEAMKLSRLKTKKETVEAGLRLLVQLQKQGDLSKLRGHLRWKGDLEEQ